MNALQTLTSAEDLFDDAGEQALRLEASMMQSLDVPSSGETCTEATILGGDDDSCISALAEMLDDALAFFDIDDLDVEKADARDANHLIEGPVLIRAKTRLEGVIDDLAKQEIVKQVLILANGMRSRALLSFGLQLDDEVNGLKRAFETLHVADAANMDEDAWKA